MPSASPHAPDTPAPVEIFPGVWRLTLGQPESITPVRTRHHAPRAEALAALPAVPEPPVRVQGTLSERGVLLSLPLAPDELVYGLGLQLKSFQQRGSKKRLRVNADPEMDTGDSHAPVPFYVTTRGYGVFVDTARYATFYLGNKMRRPATPQDKPPQPATNDGWNGVPPYLRNGLGEPSEVLIEIPSPARGVDVYVFAGPSLREAVQRYNLFSGGGVVPPRWGLGFWYRVETNFSQDDLLALADEFRTRRIPCDVLGLEPHWQSHSYSCSYAWSKRFPDPAGMLAEAHRKNFRVNVWEQAFVHPTSPLYPPLFSRSGDHEVWDGLVPDFLDPKARDAFAEYHERAHVALGIDGYKADECDNSDFTGNWSFPEISRFPSGADGEQMHSLFGLRYQDALQQIFEKRRQRTLGLVRSSGGLAAPYPYVLYSDLYDHRQFVSAIAQGSFSGLLWTPEVRDASSPDELVRRLQAVVFSPVAMVNAWYLKSPPWKQVRRDPNHAGSFVENWEQVEALCRSAIELRMRFIPYLHAAFVRYWRDGLPPFRALLMEFPDDPELHEISDQYLVGDDVLVAPVIVEPPPNGSFPAPDNRPVFRETQRQVYLPIGDWYDFWTGEKHAGKRRLDVSVAPERIPLYVRSGAILPLAQPTLHTEDPASWALTARVYGDGSRGARLYEDDGTYAASLPEVRLTWDPSEAHGSLEREPAATSRYQVIAWEHVP
ncbi:glycoside hydrolase [Opitutaceae bacterium EW11]|nr:glycoside hydrolase [Opitutaceae bacterium EW11]